MKYEFPKIGYYSQHHSHSAERPNEPPSPRHYYYYNQKSATASTKLSSHASSTHYKVERPTETIVKSRHSHHSSPLPTTFGRNHGNIHSEPHSNNNNNNDDLVSIK